MRELPIAGSLAEAVASVEDGATIMIPGFGAGTPWNLLNALYRGRATDLTFISNGAAFGAPDGPGRPEARHIADFIREGRARKFIGSFTAATHPSAISECEKAVREGRLEAELTPQGTMTERIRAAGAGIPAFYTPAAVGTLLAEGKEHRVFHGREYLLELALPADYAFVRAWKADTAGNLIYRLAARNFNPIMAMAAKTTIVEVEQPIVPMGTLAPDEIHTPGLWVSSLVQIPPDGVFAMDWLLRRRAQASRA